jgi:hypothetical protein
MNARNTDALSLWTLQTDSQRKLLGIVVLILASQEILPEPPPGGGVRGAGAASGKSLGARRHALPPFDNVTCVTSAASHRLSWRLLSGDGRQ